MDLGLKGKTALVLGASSGLGRAIALSLAAEGARVAIAGRRAEKLAETLALFPANAPQGLALEWDLAYLSVISANITKVEAAFGGIDILVNNTGGPPPTTAQGQSPDLWQENFAKMVLPVFAITDAVLPGMKARKFGRIITCTSSGVVMPIPNLAMSNTLRTSLHGWSKTLAREVAKDGITVNTIMPGRILTERITFLDGQKAKREGKDIAAVEAESIATIPMGRYGDPQEFGDAVAFLASTRAGYITGSSLRVDGGLIGAV